MALDANSIGWGLIALGVAMFIGEAMAPGFFIAVPASILVLLGVFALVTPDFAFFTAWAPLLVLLVGVPATWITVLAYRRMATPDESPTTRTAENLVGLEGTVIVATDPESARGKVKIHHQEWSARSAGETLPPGARIVVEAVEGIILVVRPAA